MSKALPTTKYFKHAQYEYYPTLVDKDIVAATGVAFPANGLGGYNTAQGRALIEAKLGKKFFTLMADLDPDVARYQLDKNLP